MELYNYHVRIFVLVSGGIVLLIWSLAISLKRGIRAGFLCIIASYLLLIPSFLIYGYLFDSSYWVGGYIICSWICFAFSIIGGSLLIYPHTVYFEELRIDKEDNINHGIEIITGGLTVFGALIQLISLHVYTNNTTYFREWMVHAADFGYLSLMGGLILIFLATFPKKYKFRHIVWIFFGTLPISFIAYGYYFDTAISYLVGTFFLNIAIYFLLLLLTQINGIQTLRKSLRKNQELLPE